MTETGSDLGVLAEASLADLRSSLKWLAAASGAVAAAVVAGIQLTALPSGAENPTRLWVASGAVIIALLLVFAFLRSTVRILTLPRPTAADLAKRETRSNVEKTLAAGGEIQDPLVRWMYGQKSYYFSDASSIENLYATDYVQALIALKELDEGNEITWNGRALRPHDESDIKSLQETINWSRRRLVALESAAHLELTRSAYQALMRRFPALGLVFVAAIVIFALATRAEPQAGAAITAPVNARVLVTDRIEAGFPDSCQVPEVGGVAVGGTWDKPTVVTVPTAECPSRTIEKGQGIIVLPIFATSSQPEPAG